MIEGLMKKDGALDTNERILTLEKQVNILKSYRGWNSTNDYAAKDAQSSVTTLLPKGMFPPSAKQSPLASAVRAPDSTRSRVAMAGH